MIRKAEIIFLLLSIQLTVQSQDFKWKSALDTVSKTGFFSIPLGVEWLAVLKTDLSDVRINNERNEVVPFIIKEHTTNPTNKLISFTVLQNKTDSALTVLELDAGSWEGSDRISLVIGNNAVEREASLSGSHNRDQWFVIHEKLQLSNDGNNADGHFVQSLHFPFVRYRYLKLTIKNKGSDALPILQTGIYVDSTAKEAEEYYLLPKTKFRFKDSTDGNTYVWINNDLPYPVDRIIMKLSGPRFYKRNVKIYKTEERKVAKLLLATAFNSDMVPVVGLNGEKTQNLLVVIENGDNPPLIIENVTTHSMKWHLLAYLEAGESYYLVGGNTKARQPLYDLAQFRDSIPATFELLGHGKLVANTEQGITSNEDNRWWLWPAILLMFGILGLLTMKLTREMKKKNL